MMRFLKCFTGITISLIGAWLGGFDDMVITLIVFIVVDYITGVINAIINKKLSSEIGFKGILKKILILVSVGLAVRLDNIFNLDESLRYITIGFYLANDGISIIENLASIGVPFPNKVKDILKQLNEESESD